MSLLPPLSQPHKKTLILDLDETLVHSSFKPISSPDFIVPVPVGGKVHEAYAHIMSTLT